MGLSITALRPGSDCVCMNDFQIERSPKLSDDELNALFTASWPGHVARGFQGVLHKSLAYFAARKNGALVGFVNLAWDGGIHGFILDTTVHPDQRRAGLGLALVAKAVEAASEAGLHWLHADYVPELEAFYKKAGFKGTAAGVMPLSGGPEA
jgi:GNAT superfamily N-acetyltransferase